MDGSTGGTLLMAQIFSVGSNSVARAVIVGVPLAVCVLVGALYAAGMVAVGDADVVAHQPAGAVQP